MKLSLSIINFWENGYFLVVVDDIQNRNFEFIIFICESQKAVELAFPTKLTSENSVIIIYPTPGLIGQSMSETDSSLNNERKSLSLSLLSYNNHQYNTVSESRFSSN